VQGQSRAAIAAYEEYLQAYPQGRFVPEARYNSALDSIKAGDHDSARRLLEPFAAGTYGGYRRAEAQRLLEALHDGGSR
jgi:TolA-binding protein